MFFKHRQGLTLAFCWLTIFGELATGARLRVGHVHNHLHGHSTNHKTDIASNLAMTIEDEKDIQMSIGSYRDVDFDHKKHKRLHHLKKKLMSKLRDANVTEVMDKMGERMPDEVVSLVHSMQKTSQKAAQPFSEKSLAKARKILNGMIEEAQNRLDEKEIECKEFENRNRKAWDATRKDQARLAEQITGHIGVIGKAEQGIKMCDDMIDDLKETMQKEYEQYMKIKKADDAEMALRLDDLAVADFILSFTICDDKKPPAAILAVNKSSQASSNLNTKTCQAQEGQLEMHFEDPVLEAQAQKVLTPGARQKLRMWLSDGHAETMHNDLMLQEETTADDGKDSEAVVKSSHTHHKHHQHHHHYHHHGTTVDDRPDARIQLEEVLGTNKPAALVQMEEVPVMKGAVPGASPTQSKKCVLGKPNCGLLHDNMSIMYGKFKDLVDELKAKMDEDAANWEALKTDLNAQIETLTTAKNMHAAQMNEAIADKAADVEEQQEKAEEEYILQKEWLIVDKECRETIYEILYTDICGVLTVRGEVSKFSKEVPPNDIQDCEFGDLEPGPCSVECDDRCMPKDMSQCVGGITTLTREIIMKQNEFGHACPKLTYQMRCGMFRCPVDCGMSSWSAFTKCTKECEMGSKLRSRSIVVKPKNGGEKCEDTAESQVCNTGSCDRDCDLKPWTIWTPCSMGCGGGMQVKFRHIKRKLRGNGKCPKSKSRYRFRERDCNTQMCVGDEKCIAQMDFIFLLDGSGSMREKGYEILKEFSARLIERFEGEAYEAEAAQVGIVQFGNGMVLPDKDSISGTTISPAKLVLGMSFDMKEVAGAMRKTVWEKGFTNMAQAFSTAQTIMLNGGRKSKPTTIVVVTDGKPTFKFETWNKRKEITDEGTKVVMVVINDRLGKKDRAFMKKLASGPDDENVVMIPGVKKLKADMDTYVTKTLVHSCSRTLSPSANGDMESSVGYMKLRENEWCGEKEKNPDLHKLLGIATSASECYSWAIQAEAKYFSFNVGTFTDINRGQCHAELSEDGEKCPEGWEERDNVDYYKILKFGMRLQVTTTCPPSDHRQLSIGLGLIFFIS